MPKTTNEVFRDDYIHATYKGNEAKIVPLTAALLADLDQSAMRRPAGRGQLLLGWNDGAKRNGHIINADATNDISIIIKRADGSDYSVSARDMGQAVLSLLRASKSAREEAQNIERQNAEAQAAYEAAVERGENPARPEPATPTFADNAFARVPMLAETVTDAMTAIKNDPLSDTRAKSGVDYFMAQLRELSRDELTNGERRMIEEARKLRAEIAALNPEHDAGVAKVEIQPYTGDNEAQRKVFSELPLQQMSHADMMRVAQSQASLGSGAALPMETALRVLGAATSTPVRDMSTMPITHASFRTIEQEMRRHENAQASDTILPRMAAITRDEAPGYQWSGKIYTKDGADVLLMRDAYAAVVYAWDSASRLNDLNLEDVLRQDATLADVPTQEALEGLRQTLADLRLDNGAAVNFDWEDDAEAEVVEEEANGQIPQFD